MAITVCFSANTFYYPTGGGHMWVYINWALGLKASGCEIIWLEGVHCELGADHFNKHFVQLKEKLDFFGLSNQIAFWVISGDPAIIASVPGFMVVDEAASRSDILLNQFHNMRSEVVSKFKKTALLDIDPGLTQIWMTNGDINVAPHDIYFTIGETVGKENAKFPDAGIDWNYIPPCILIDEWPVTKAADTAPFTTISHWSSREWVVNNKEVFLNDKKSGFMPYIEIPLQFSRSFELATWMGEGEENDKEMLERSNWIIRDSQTLTSTPEKYRHYIQSSWGEFSAVKPSCVILQNAWISDRSLCYLASGKPVIVQNTGPSSFLPDAAGLFRFNDFGEAVLCIEDCERNYEHHCKFARSLVEEYFDAKKVTKLLLEKCL